MIAAIHSVDSPCWQCGANNVTRIEWRDELVRDVRLISTDSTLTIKWPWTVCDACGAEYKAVCG